MLIPGIFHRFYKPIQLKKAFLFSPPFGCLDRVDLGFCFRGLLQVGCQVATAVFPFHGRLRKRRTEPAGIMFFTPVATSACFDDFSAGTTIEGTALCAHKRTFFAFSRGFAYQHVSILP